VGKAITFPERYSRRLSAAAVARKAKALQENFYFARKISEKIFL